MHDPREPHLMTTKCILHYLQGTLDYDLLLRHASTSVLVVYNNADWVGCPNTRRSTSSYVVFLGNNLVSRSSKCQNIVPHLSVEAEYCVVANNVVEVCWLHQFLVELHNPLSWATLIYCDNVSVVYFCTNPIQHQRTMHVEIDLNFIHEHVATVDICVPHVPTISQFADIFTKWLLYSLFLVFRSSLNICSSYSSIVGGVRESLY
jgi:hypothetical protein